MATNLSVNLREKRLAAGMSMAALERASGVSKSSIGAYEKSKRIPKPKGLLALAHALQCEPEALAPYHTWPVGGPTISAADELCHNCRTLSLGLWSMATRFQGRLTDVESRALTQASAILGNGLTAFAKKPKRKAM
jgi:transcriptional regulator with XRE-family HTH domain